GPVISTGTGAGGGPQVNVFRVDPAGNPTAIAQFMAYDSGFTGGVQASLVPVGGDRYGVTGAGPAGGPHVKRVKLADAVPAGATQMGPGFMAYATGFTGGARVAATTDGAGRLLIVTGVGSGGGPHVKIFEITDLTTGDAVQRGDGFMAYDPGFTGGVN